jgi:hypothetical protein
MSFLKAVESASIVDRFAAVAITSDPAGIFPSVFSAKSAFAASRRIELLINRSPGTLGCTTNKRLTIDDKPPLVPTAATTSVQVVE